MIYFIQAGNNGPIKIGQTDNNIEERIKQLQIGCPYELRLLWLHKSDHYKEQEIHKEFSSERIRGEWFHPSRKIFDFIDNEMSNFHEIEMVDGETFNIIECFRSLNEISSDFGFSIFYSGNELHIECYRNLEIELTGYYKIKNEVV